jgi:uncharacterized membrane protein YjdF
MLTQKMIEEYQRALTTMGASGNDIIDYLFKLCVVLLVDLANLLGMSYEELNVWLFMIIVPIILLGQAMWIIILRYQLSKARNASLR